MPVIEQASLCSLLSHSLDIKVARGNQRQFYTTLHYKEQHLFKKKLFQADIALSGLPGTWSLVIWIPSTNIQSNSNQVQGVSRGIQGVSCQTEAKCKGY